MVRTMNFWEDFVRSQVRLRYLGKFKMPKKGLRDPKKGRKISLDKPCTKRNLRSLKDTTLKGKVVYVKAGWVQGRKYAPRYKETKGRPTKDAISTKDVTMTMKKNKCRNKYITSRHKLRTKGQRGQDIKLIRT